MAQGWGRRLGRRRLLALAVAVTACATAACASTGAHRSGGGGVIRVVAAENFWGSIVSQLGGTHVQVMSVVSDPNADPHDYESSATDARAVDQADYVIENGAGYDDWCDKLLSTNPESQRKLLNVADLLGKHEGDNPHFWYSPTYVTTVEDRIEADLKALDPADTADFTRLRAATDAAFAPMRQQLAAIRQAYQGTPVAATESIVQYLTEDLGLRLISPPAFMDAVAEDTDPPAGAVAQFQDQLRGHQARILLYNEQTATAMTSSIRALATANGIPTVGVTETLVPSGATFQAWFGAELTALDNALHGSAA